MADEIRVCRATVNERELLVRKLRGDSKNCLFHVEANANGHVVMRREVCKIRNVFRGRVRNNEEALDFVFGLRLLQTDVGEVVEGLVIHTAYVEHDADGQVLGRGEKART